jgi:hypothetical protein
VKVASRIAPILFVLLLSYLSGSFIAASFDITTWTPEGRSLALMFGLVLGIWLMVAEQIGDRL